MPNDDDGVPKTLLGYAQFDSRSTGTLTDSSLSATINLTRGTQYWIAWFKNGTNANPSCFVTNSDYDVGYGVGGNVFGSELGTLTNDNTASPTSFESTIDPTALSIGGWPRLCVGLKW